jgi:hypothetical protein
MEVNWNPSADLQAAQRVYRYGQTRPVFVYRLVLQHSCEEHLLKQQFQKIRLSDAVLESHKISDTSDYKNRREFYTIPPHMGWQQAQLARAQVTAAAAATTTALPLTAYDAFDELASGAFDDGGRMGASGAGSGLETSGVLGPVGVTLLSEACADDPVTMALRRRLETHRPAPSEMSDSPSAYTHAHAKAPQSRNPPMPNPSSDVAMDDGHGYDLERDVEAPPPIPTPPYFQFVSALVDQESLDITAMFDDTSAGVDADYLFTITFLSLFIQLLRYHA